jgi:transposase
VIDHLDFLDRSIATLSAEICERLVPFEPQVALLTSIPGISATTAQVIVAETGADMSRFPTAGHLCAWAGVAPASYESAGKKRPAGTRMGAPWLKRTLIEAARAAVRTKGSYYSALYARIARRRGPNKSRGRRGPLHAGNRLAPAQHGRPLPRPRCRLLRAPSRSGH